MKKPASQRFKDKTSALQSLCHGRWRAGASLMAVMLLSGCFLAENDDADPIIPDAALTYPMPTGPARQCSEESSGKQSCVRALLEKRTGGGYSLAVWSKGKDDAEKPSSTKHYKLRSLKGTDVPQGSYLVQTIDNDANSRSLGLIIKRTDGGWEQIEPQCDQLQATRFVEFMTKGWITTGPEAKLKGVVCNIARKGLTDSRLHSILSSAQESSATILYPEG